MKLFIDDLRHPYDRSWVVTRSAEATTHLIEQWGTPSHISFDHDLGENVKTGHDIAHWIIEASMDGKLDFSRIKEIYVHSANPVGTRNILGLFESYARHLLQNNKIVNMPVIKQVIL